MFLKRRTLWQTILSFVWPLFALAVCLFPVYPYQCKIVVLYSCPGALLFIISLLLCKIPSLSLLHTSILCLVLVNLCILSCIYCCYALKSQILHVACMKIMPSSSIFVKALYITSIDVCYITIGVSNISFACLLSYKYVDSSTVDSRTNSPYEQSMPHLYWYERSSTANSTSPIICPLTMTPVLCFGERM